MRNKVENIVFKRRVFTCEKPHKIDLSNCFKFDQLARN